MFEFRERLRAGEGYSQESADKSKIGSMTERDWDIAAGMCSAVVGGATLFSRRISPQGWRGASGAVGPEQLWRA
eukprot:3220356-Prorocentrum_lima.AAC.1